MYANPPKTSLSDDASNLVNLNRYPIDKLSSILGQSLIADCQKQLDDIGCCHLREFINPNVLDLLRNESEKISVHAHYSNTLANVYFSQDDESFPRNHPKRFFVTRTSGFVRPDFFPADSAIRKLYNWEAFAAFIQACVRTEKLCKYNENLSDIVLNVVKPEQKFPWHFDTNHITVTIIIQNPETGGIFEYCPNIRSRDNENYDAVMKVLEGDRSLVRSLNLMPGDMQIFKGRYSLHRVKAVEGSRARYTAVFSYAEEPQMFGKAYLNRQLYGKVLSNNDELDKTAHRKDGLED